MTRHRRNGSNLPTFLWIAGLALVLIPDGVRTAEAFPPTAAVMQRLIERAQAVARQDHGPQYQFEKRTVREELNARGERLKSEEKLYQVELLAGWPFNRLIKIQGRNLSAEELAKEQHKEERFRQKILGADPRKLAARKQAWVTPQLLERYEFTVRERIVVSNRATLVLTFQPRAGRPPPRTIQDQVLNRMSGTLWVDEADAEAVRVMTKLMEPVSVGWFGVLGSLSRCELSLDRQRLPDGVWVHTRQVLLIQSRKLTSTRHFRDTEESGAFQKVEPKPSRPAN